MNVQSASTMNFSSDVRPCQSFHLFLNGWREPDQNYSPRSHGEHGGRQILLPQVNTDSYREVESMSIALICVHLLHLWQILVAFLCVLRDSVVNPGFRAVAGDRASHAVNTTFTSDANPAGTVESGQGNKLISFWSDRMKRAAILLAAGLVFGCQQEQNTPAKSAEGAAKEAPAMVYPSHESEPAGMEFEMNKDGKTYVFGYLSTLNAVKSGQPVAYLVEKPNFNGTTDVVVFEDDGKGLEARLEKDYMKNHPK